MRFPPLISAIILIALWAVAGAGAVTDGLRSAQELRSAGCTLDPYPGVSTPDGGVLAVVYVSGRGETLIDGRQDRPFRQEPVQGFEADWYETPPGTHTVSITRAGVTPFSVSLPVCSVRMSYLFYDMQAHPATGTTPVTAVPVTTAPPVTMTEPAVSTTRPETTAAGEYTDFREALANASRTMPSAENSGAVTVTTEPPGATVYIDGIEAGITPVTVTGIPPGTRTLYLRLAGYQDIYLQVSVSPGVTGVYSATMPKTGAAPASTRKSSAAGAGIVAAVIAGFLMIRHKSA